MSRRLRLLSCILAGHLRVLMALSSKVVHFGVEYVCSTPVWFSFSFLFFATRQYFQDSLVSVFTLKVSYTYTNEFDEQING